MSHVNLNFSKRISLTCLPLDGYAIVEKIGAGSYSTVYKGFKKTGHREAVAIKCVEKTKLSPSGVENIITEISMMKMLKHKYIVQMKEFQWDDRFIYIIMEYCDGGDLSNFIKKRRKLRETTCQRFMQQLAVALKFLRLHNICHLDLKPQNLLIVTQPGLFLKVGDFGFAQFLSSETYQRTLRGSPLYMAPEMLIKRHYDAKVDLWSVGVILYECLFGKPPYYSSSISELEEKIRSEILIEIPEDSGISTDCRDVLQRLLQHKPESRIDFEEFFNHPFLDLEHFPSPESKTKAVKLVHEGVKLDINKDYKEAFLMYCEGLRYLVPMVVAEDNVERKAGLKKKVTAYIKRAEELKTALYLEKPVEQQRLVIKPSESVSTTNTASSKVSSKGSINTTNLSEDNVERKSTLKSKVSADIKRAQELKMSLKSTKENIDKKSVLKKNVSADTKRRAEELKMSLKSTEKDLERKSTLKSKVSADIKHAEELKMSLKSAEKNLERKSTLKSKVSADIKHAEELKMSLNSDTPVQQQSVVEKPSVSVSKTENTSSEVSSTDSINTTNLTTLCIDTPSMLRGLNIGDSGQKYLAEGKYVLALEKFEASLDVLVPLLAEEPMGLRKELLHKQIQDWLKQAESTKTLLAFANINPTSEAETEAFKDVCIIQ